MLKKGQVWKMRIEFKEKLFKKFSPKTLKRNFRISALERER